MELDMDKLMKAIDNVEARIKTMGEKADGELQTLGKVSGDTKTALEKLGNEQREFGERLHMLEQKGALQGGEGDEGRKAGDSVGSQFTKSTEYGDWVRARKSGSRAPIGMDLKNTVTNAIGNTYADRRPGVLAGAFRNLRIESLLNTVPTDAPSIQYVKENVFTNNAAEVAEGAVKAESSITFSPATVTIETIAHWIKITEQLAADNSALTAYINARMVYGVNLRVENQLIAGNGVSPNLSGLANTGNFTAHGYTAASLTGAGLLNNRFDLIGKIIGDSEATDWPADVILMNPADWWTMRLSKDSQNRYLLGEPGTPGERTLFGLPIVTSNAITADNVMVANLGLAATLYAREGIRVEMSNSDGDNFQRNLITLRAERRCGLAVERAAAIRYGDLTPA